MRLRKSRFQNIGLLAAQFVSLDPQISQIKQKTD